MRSKSIWAAVALLMATPQAIAAPALPADGQVTLEQLKQTYSDPASRYAQIGGIKVRYKDQGHGPAVVLLHGSYSSLDGYDRLAARLAAHHRVIRFDLPGMGLSETLPDSTPTSTQFGDDVLKALLDQLHVEKVVVVGVSSGGAIGFTFASRFPDRVTAMVLSNTPADPVVNENVPRPDYLTAHFRRTEKTGFRDLPFWDAYLRWLAADPKRLTDAWVRRYYDMNRRTLPDKAHYYWRSTRDPIATQATIAKVQAPTLLIWGLHDAVLPAPTMDALKSYLKAAPVSTVVLPDVGHYPIMEVPDRAADLIEGWLGVIASPSAP
jgi:pimeloyl-ACP methyl ester carboxylesterase